MPGALPEVRAQPEPSCRTPCLAVPPRAQTAPATDVPAKAEDDLAKAAPQPQPAANRPRPARAREAVAPAPAGVARTPSRRCVDITVRAQVGEPVSEHDMAYLRSEC